MAMEKAKSYVVDWQVDEGSKVWKGLAAATPLCSSPVCNIFFPFKCEFLDEKAKKWPVLASLELRFGRRALNIWMIENISASLRRTSSWSSYMFSYM